MSCTCHSHHGPDDTSGSPDGAILGDAIDAGPDLARADLEVGSSVDVEVADRPDASLESEGADAPDATPPRDVYEASDANPLDDGPDVSAPPGSCHGHGVLQPDGVCRCDPAYTGPDCGACSLGFHDEPACEFDPCAATTCPAPLECSPLLGGCRCPTGLVPVLDLLPGAQVGGEIKTLAVADGRLYTSQGRALNVYDGAGYAPVRVARLVVDGVIADLKVVGSLAYLATARGLTIVDVAQPDAPTMLSTLPDEEWLASVAVALPYAYVLTSYPRRLVVVDVSDPLAPAIVGDETIGGYGNGGVAVSGDLVGVAAGNSGVAIVDVATPFAPFTTYVEPAGSCLVVAFRGSTLYAGWEDGRLSKTDLSEPLQRTTTSFLPLPLARFGADPITSLLVVDDVLYAGASAGLYRVDLHVPFESVVPEPFPFLGTFSLAWGDGVLFGSTWQGLWSELSDHLADATVHWLDDAFPANRLTVARGFAFSSTQKTGTLYFSSVAEPSAPTLPRFVTPPPLASCEGTTDLFARGTTLYFLGSPHLILTDVTVPDAADCPVSIELGGLLRDLYVLDGYAYVVGPDHLYVVGVSNPLAPTLVADLEIPAANPGRVFASGHTVLVADGGPSVVLVDVSEPAHPTVGAVLELPGPALDVAAAGGYAYLAVDYDGMAIVDVHDPSQPGAPAYLFPAGSSPPYPTPAREVAVSGGYLWYVSSTTVALFDVADPLHPVDLAALDLRAAARDLDVRAPYAFFAAGADGFEVVSYTCVAP